MSRVTADVDETEPEGAPLWAEGPFMSACVAVRGPSIAPGADAGGAKERHDLWTPNMAFGACTCCEAPSSLSGHAQGGARVWGRRVATRIKMLPHMGPRGASRALGESLTAGG